jgi:diaminopimelate decarboxylase
MIKASASFQNSFSSASALPIVPHGVPRDVVFKYDVETTSESAEKIMSRKITEASLENEAFYIVNLSTVARKYSEWVAHLPRVKPYYAIKCNPNSAIIRTLASLGVNFDCARYVRVNRIL